MLLEVGVSQSLPALRRRAYALCSPTERHNWANLNYVVLIKRYEVAHLYIEIWRPIESQPGTPSSDRDFIKDQRAPGDLGLTHTMEFVANALASNLGSHGPMHCTGSVICLNGASLLLVTIFWLKGQLLSSMHRICWINANTTMIQRMML